MTEVEILNKVSTRDDAVFLLCCFEENYLFIKNKNARGVLIYGRLSVFDKYGYVI